MSQKQSKPTRYTCNGVEFMIWDDNLEAGPNGWTVFPRNKKYAVLQYRDIPKDKIIEDIETRMDESEWPLVSERTDEDRATKMESERLSADD